MGWPLPLSLTHLIFNNGTAKVQQRRHNAHFICRQKCFGFLKCQRQSFRLPHTHIHTHTYADCHTYTHVRNIWQRCAGQPQSVSMFGLAAIISAEKNGATAITKSGIKEEEKQQKEKKHKTMKEMCEKEKEKGRERGK